MLVSASGARMVTDLMRYQFNRDDLDSGGKTVIIKQPCISLLRQLAQ